MNLLAVADRSRSIESVDGLRCREGPSSLVATAFVAV